MARMTEMASFAGEGQEIFILTIRAFHPGKAVVQVPTFQVAGNDFLQVGPPKSVPPFEPLLEALNEGFPMVFHAPVIIGGLEIPGAVNGGGS